MISIIVISFSGGVGFKKMARNEKGGKLDKGSHCFYCRKTFCRIEDHLMRIHRKEKEVQDILLAANAKLKKVRLTILRNRGNYRHNIEGNFCRFQNYYTIESI